MLLVNNNFRLTATVGETSAEGTIDEVIAWDENDVPVEVERYLTFYMKWDECCHINFGEKDNDGYLHLCGEDSFKQHAQLMTELFAWAKKEIPMMDWSTGEAKE